MATSVNDSSSRPDPTHSHLEAFVRQACGEVALFFGAPERGELREQIWFVLIGLSPNLAVRNDVRQPLQVYRRYLVGASAEDTSRQAALLEALMFRALMFRGLDGQDIQLVPEPPPNDLWLALGMPPQAAFLLSVPVFRERQIIKAPPVETVELELTPTGTLQGRVIDASGMPLKNCVVEIPSQRLGTTTDVEGRFTFASLSRTAAYPIHVVWKDRELTMQPVAGSGFSEPLTVMLDSKTSRVKKKQSDGKEA
ncbi:MAG: carboxypeptidase-like regulatory domain-containing protein [Betaproteobacteria bacterium]